MGGLNQLVKDDKQKRELKNLKNKSKGKKPTVSNAGEDDFDYSDSKVVSIE